MTRSTRRGFTFIDLGVSLGLVLPILAMMPAMNRAREQGNRVKCASNLRIIGLAMQMYANDNRGNFPRTMWDAEAESPVPTQYTGVNAPNPFLQGGPAPHDVTGALFLLQRTQDITSEVWVCPTTGAKPWDFNKATPKSVSNFPSREFLGYSYINPYPTRAARTMGFKLNFTLPSDFAVAADMNPGGTAVTQVAYTSPRTQMQAANSRNHAGDGQNVLYADGHAEFATTPFAGMTVAAPGGGLVNYRDNIYVAGPQPPSANGSGGVLNSGAQHANDSILLPTHLDGYQPPAAAGGGSNVLVIVLAAVLVIGIVVALVIFMRSRRPKTPPPLPPMPA